MRNQNEKYCSNCAAVIDIRAEICPRCGVRQMYPNTFRATNPNAYRDPSTSDKDWLVTLILCICFGYLGIHRFYTNSIGIGIVLLLTGGGCGIWWLIDFIMIVTGSYKDDSGRYVKQQ